MPRPPPPPGPPWDLPLADAPLAFVDLEMTGLDPERDRVVEVCIVRARASETEGSLVSLVRPSERIGGSAEIHGLDAAALAGAPAFDEIADRCLALLDGAVFVAHAADWDARFLAAEMTRAGRAWAVPPFVDTLELARRSYAFPSYSLDALCKRLAIERGTAHRAASDVDATRALFAKVVDVLKPTTVRDLWEVRTGERIMREETANTMLRLLTDAVDNGRAQPAVIPGYSIAGKTGTAQIAATSTEVVEVGRNSDGHPIYQTHTQTGYQAGWIDSSFISIMPADHPQLVTLLLIHRPVTWGLFKVVQTPVSVFRSLAPQIFDYLAIPPDRIVAPVAAR